MSLEDIIREGNRGPNYRHNNKITCKDGFKLSVIAGGGTYCTPRVALGSFVPGYDERPETYTGPFTAVEVGYPSERPEPWNCSGWHEGFDNHDDHDACYGWERYADAREWDDVAIFSFVPVDMVRALVDSHGGEA